MGRAHNLEKGLPLGSQGAGMAALHCNNGPDQEDGQPDRKRKTIAFKQQYLKVHARNTSCACKNIGNHAFQTAI
ncbi:jg11389 [Pararge aegeria aegeria]|uniref:Jg11389 protein n=1 Tax=Pararge aegeria aegeria TaxID=348720 RepID=A0A8S4RHC0_9NEOP|nr:jg11389 [Pararge aegeria aegeria]